MYCNRLIVDHKKTARGDDERKIKRLKKRNIHAVLLLASKIKRWRKTARGGKFI